MSLAWYVSNDDDAYRYEFIRGLLTRPEQYCALGVGYSLDQEKFNFTPVLHITKRGQAVDLSEDKNTNTNSNTYKKRTVTQVKPATILRAQ